MSISEDINRTQKFAGFSAGVVSLLFAIALLWNIFSGAFPHGTTSFAYMILIFPVAILCFSVALLTGIGNPDAVTKTLQVSVSGVYSLVLAYFAFAALYSSSTNPEDKEIIEAFLLPVIALALAYAFPYYVTKYAANLVEVENK